MFYKDLILSSAFDINKMCVEEQQQFIQYVFRIWEELDKNNRKTVITSLRESFFRTMTYQQKKTYILLLAEELCKDSLIDGDLLELLGQLIKYVDFDAGSIIRQVLMLADRICKIKDQICLIHFCKYVWNVCDDQLHIQIIRLLEQQQHSENINLAEIATDVIYAINSKPICRFKEQLALVIPEFLTSASFLQQPIDYMRALSFLKEKGLDGDIIDNRVHNYSLSHLTQILTPYKIIVITSSPVDMVQKYYVDFRYCVFCETVNWLYRKFPDKQIIVCGAHGTVDKSLLCKDINCHQILSGENTRAIISFLLGEVPESLLDYQIKLDTVDMNWYYGRKIVDGVTYREKHYSIMQLSQGCPYHCLFCYNIYGHIVKRVPVNKAIMQLQELQEAGVNHVFFIDQTFTLDKDYILEFCQAICNSNISISWQCETRADLISRSLVDAMKSAGCSVIWLGFESFSQQVLDANNKQLTKQQQLLAIQIIQEAGIVCSGFVMLGMAADTHETIQETIDTVLSYRIPTSRTANLCTVRIGTELYNKATQAGVVHVNSFCDLESYRGSLLNNLTEKELIDALQRFSLFLN